MSHFDELPKDNKQKSFKLPLRYGLRNHVGISNQYSILVSCSKKTPLHLLFKMTDHSSKYSACFTQFYWLFCRSKYSPTLPSLGKYRTSSSFSTLLWFFSPFFHIMRVRGISLSVSFPCKSRRCLTTPLSIIMRFEKIQSKIWIFARLVLDCQSWD